MNRASTGRTLVFAMALAACAARLEAQTVGSPVPQPCAWVDNVEWITGTLERLTFPGPPNYADTTLGDSAETGFYLRIQPPWCLVFPTEPPTKGPLGLAQLLLDSTGYAQLRPQLGESVAVLGRVREPETGHHHGDALLEDILAVRCLNSSTSHGAPSALGETSC